MTATPSSEVAIGRWMKGDETLMGWRPGADPRSDYALLSLLRARHRYLRSLGEAGKSGRDHALACLQARGDRGLHVVLLHQRHAPHSDGVALLEHVHECPAGPALEGGGRNHAARAQRIEKPPHVDELPGPKLKV